MKLLENPIFEGLSHALTRRTSDCFFEAKFESYSCKMITKDKKLFRNMSIKSGMSPNDLQALSPPNSIYGLSPSRSTKNVDGDTLCDAISVKTLFYLISTLNESFQPSYDFSQSRSEDFTLISDIPSLINTINCQLMSVLGSDSDVSKQLWTAIDTEIGLHDCKAYSYNEKQVFEPYEDCLWFFNYFFYNRKLRRVFFFTCSAKSLQNSNGSDFEDYEMEDQWSMED